MALPVPFFAWQSARKRLGLHSRAQARAWTTHLGLSSSCTQPGLRLTSCLRDLPGQGRELAQCNSYHCRVATTEAPATPQPLGKKRARRWGEYESPPKAGRIAEPITVLDGPPSEIEVASPTSPVEPEDAPTEETLIY